MLKTLELFYYPAPSAPSALRVKKQSVSAKQSSWTALSCILLALNAFLLMGYLSSVNSQSLRGYEMKQVQNRLQQLTDENRKINLKISEAASMVSIQSDFLKANYVAADTGKFLQAGQYSYNP